MTISVLLRKLKIAAIFIISCLVSAVSLLVLKLAGLGSVVSALWFLGITIFIIVSTYNMHVSHQVKDIIYIGFIFRLILMSIVIMKVSPLADLISGPDQSQFWNVASKYYQGVFDFESTKYPYLMNVMFHIAGQSKFVISMINVLFWFLGIYVLLAVTGGYGKRMQQILMFFYILLPYQMILNAGMYRESILCFSIMLSYYFLWKWMNDRGRYRYMIVSLLAAFPAFWLHTGYIAMYGMIFFTYVFWCPKMMKWRKINLRVLLLIIAAIFIVPIYNYFLSRFFTGYFPSSFNLLIFFNRPFDPGRTDYVPAGVHVGSINDFVFWCIYRMIYYWISPSPRFWSSYKDVLFFAVDVIPWVCFFAWLVYGLRKKHLNKQAYSAVIGLFLFTFIFAWGTTNAGTAMRHRDSFVGLFAVAGFIALRKDESQLTLR